MVRETMNSFSDTSEWTLDEAMAVCDECVSIISHCRSFLAAGPEHPMPNTGERLSRIRSQWLKYYVDWSSVTADSDMMFTLVELMVCAMCYLEVSGNPGLMTTKGYMHTYSMGFDLQVELRKCQLEWCSKNAYWAERFDSMWNRFCTVMVSSMNNFQPDEAIHAAPSMMSSAVYADVDVHTESETNAALVELKADQKLEAELDQERKALRQGSSSSTDRPSAIDPRRFAMIGGRTMFVIHRDMEVIQQHTADLHVWTRGHKGVDRLLRDLVSFEITDTTSKQARDTFLARACPSGSMEEAVRHCNRRWDALTALSVFVTENGKHALATASKLTDLPCSSVFCDEKKQVWIPGEDEWEPIHDAWLLALWDRAFRTHLKEDFLHAYIIQSHELTQYRGKWVRDGLTFHGIPRSPRVLEIGGAWFVSTPIVPDVARDTRTASLTHCGSLRDALQCWTHTIAQEPFGMKLSNRKPLSDTIGVVLAPEA